MLVPTLDPVPGKLARDDVADHATARADAGQARDRDPHRRRLAVRAEVGRLPLHRVPRRRRDRAGQPQRAPVHPLLPRAARAAAARRCPQRCVVDGEIVVPADRRPRARLRRAAAAHPPGRVAGAPARRRDAGVVRRLRPARRWATSRCSTRPLADAPRVCSPSSWPTQRRPSTCARSTTDQRRRRALVRRVRGRRARRRRRQAARDPYTPDKRTLVKVKHQRTADCVVAGYRIHKDGNGVGSLLLGLYDDDGDLHHVGVVAVVHGQAPRRAARRARAADPRRARGPSVAGLGRVRHARGGVGTRMPGGGSRWNAGKDLSGCRCGSSASPRSP